MSEAPPEVLASQVHTFAGAALTHVQSARHLLDLIIERTTDPRAQSSLRVYRDSLAVTEAVLSRY